MTILRKILPYLILLSCTQLEARHIIGGEITYVCRGGGNYDFTMRIYRDCAGNGACFDAQLNCQSASDAHVTFFDGTMVIGVVYLNPPTVRRIWFNSTNCWWI